MNFYEQNLWMLIFGWSGIILPIIHECLSFSLMAMEVELFCLFLAEVRCIDNFMFHLMK